MRRSTDRAVRPVLLVLLCVGVGLLAAVPLGASGAPGDHGPQTNQTDRSGNGTVASVDINCTRGEIAVAAPGDYRYRLTTAVVNVTPSTSSTARSTVGPVTGNETVNVTGEGAVFAFVQNASTAGERDATAVEYCGDAGPLGDQASDTAQANDTGYPLETVPAIRVDCDERLVRFVAPDAVNYTASTTVVSVSPTDTSARRTAATFRGDATATVGDGRLVIAFASAGRLGDEQTVSVARDCGTPDQHRGGDET